jgi:hypothetical protein
VGLFADIVSALGIPKSIGQIYGLLYASATPLSFSDIVDRLDISKGSVSQGLQLLRSLGAINVADLKLKALSDKQEADFAEAKGEGRSAKSQVRSGKGDANGRMPVDGDRTVTSDQSAMDSGRRADSAPSALGSLPPASGSAPLALTPLPLASASSPSALGSLPFASGSPHREYFEPELSLRRLVAGVLRERVTPFATTGANRLARLRELARPSDDTEKHYLDRVKQLESWRRRLKTVLPVLGALLGPKVRK